MYRIVFPASSTVIISTLGCLTGWWNGVGVIGLPRPRPGPEIPCTGCGPLGTQ